MQSREYPYSQKLVVIGGGTGEFTFLRGAVKLNNPELITAEPHTADSGGSGGRLRTELGTLPWGDARRCLIGLMEHENQQEVALRISDDRFKNLPGPLNGHDLWNLELEVLERIYHSAERGLDAFRALHNIRGKVIPSGLDLIDILTIRKSGKKHFSEAELDDWAEDPQFDSNDKIVDIFLNPPSPQANPRAVEAIKKADKIVFPSGSLFGSILPHLLIDEIRLAILNSDAPLVFVMNIMTERAQTDFMTGAEHIKWFTDLLGDKSRLTHVIANRNNLDPKTVARYKELGQEPVVINEEEIRDLYPGLKLLRDADPERPLVSYLEREHLLRHNHEVLAEMTLQAA